MKEGADTKPTSQINQKTKKGLNIMEKGTKIQSLNPKSAQ